MTLNAGPLPAIVLVEDDQDIRLILTRVIRGVAAGHDLVAVDQASAALLVLATRPVPLLITDYNLPGMRGLELVAAAKRIQPATRLVLISAYATPELARSASAVGADYLPKPFPFDQLEAIVRDALAL